MYKRDLITAEIEKLAQVLARILGLKTELKLDEAASLFDETMESSFGLNPSLIHSVDDADFRNWLKNQELGPEKINSLTDFIFSELDFEQRAIESFQLAQKLDLLYQHLVEVHHTVHLINMGRQKYIQQYL